MSELILTVNGQNYGGWTSISVNRSIESVAGTFDLIVTERWSEQPTIRPIRPGQTATVSIDGQTVITGFIDDVLPSLNGNEHQVKFTGRSRTADLVDCSAIHKTGQWKKKSLKTIAQDVCRPFGINVVVETNIGGPIESESISNGESVMELLERVARQRGVMLTSNAASDLVITRAGKKRMATAIVEGENMLGAAGKFSHRDRHSIYIGKGEQPDTGFIDPVDAAEPSAEVSDSDIRYRPLVLLAEDNATPETMKKRVTWERNVRYGRSTRVTLTVQGWKADGVIWQPNSLVKTKSPSIGVDTELLIVGVNYILDSEGERTQMVLTGAGAFDVLELPPADDSFIL
ncbi:MAG: hypothetical protein GKR93_11890 [Gammaproteobacteria bacterium]|nr:hypothetical protein [Gammaproteobacteria bacterium]